MKRSFFFIIFSIVTIFFVSADQTAPRIALVIGNGNYEVSPLKNPKNDATDISHALGKLGFNVSTLINSNKREMFEAIRDFGKALSMNPDSTGLFYYAGHGMQVNGRNYLIPIDSNISAEDEVEFEAIDTGQVLSKMESAGNKTNIIILDACRDNPFMSSFRSSTRGLAVIDAPSGSLIVYATAPGDVAAEGTGRNGVFTGAFLNNIGSVKEIESMLKDVRQEVMTATGGKQTPWSSSSLPADFYFTVNEIEINNPSTIMKETDDFETVNTSFRSGSSAEISVGPIFPLKLPVWDRNAVNSNFGFNLTAGYLYQFPKVISLGFNLNFAPYWVKGEDVDNDGNLYIFNVSTMILTAGPKIAFGNKTDGFAFFIAGGAGIGHYKLLVDQVTAGKVLYFNWKVSLGAYLKNFMISAVLTGMQEGPSFWIPTFSFNFGYSFYFGKSRKNYNRWGFKTDEQSKQ